MPVELSPYGLGTIKKDLVTPDNIHLSPAGHAVYAEKLKPLLAKPSSDEAPPATK